jgi:hypothetical protein
MVAVEPGHPARSMPSTMALRSLRDSRKLALRAQTIWLSDAPFRQEPQRLGHHSLSHAPAQLLYLLPPIAHGLLPITRASRLSTLNQRIIIDTGHTLGLWSFPFKV